jgi:hypothetical protein
MPEDKPNCGRLKSAFGLCNKPNAQDRNAALQGVVDHSSPGSTVDIVNKMSRNSRIEDALEAAGVGTPRSTFDQGPS